MNLFLQTAPNSITDVIKLPAILLILGLGLWYAGLYLESRTEKAWLKWLAFIPLGIGLVMGLQSTIQAMDYVYQQTLPNRKTLYGHYIALILPLTGIITVVAWHFYLKRSGSYERY